MIPRNFCPWHNSFAVVVCAKTGFDLMAENQNIAEFFSMEFPLWMKSLWWKGPQDSIDPILHNPVLLIPGGLSQNDCHYSMEVRSNPRLHQGAFQKSVWALNSKGSKKFNIFSKKTYLSMYGQDILCGISKVLFEIPYKISFPYIERCIYYWHIDI